MRGLQMHPGTGRHENAREDACSDALLAMPEGVLVVDVNVMHALAVTYLQGTVAAGKSAEVDGGAAAAMGEHNKEDEYRRDIDGGVRTRAVPWGRGGTPRGWLRSPIPRDGRRPPCTVRWPRGRAARGWAPSPGPEDRRPIPWGQGLASIPWAANVSAAPGDGTR